MVCRCRARVWLRLVLCFMKAALMLSLTVCGCPFLFRVAFSWFLEGWVLSPFWVLC